MGEEEGAGEEDDEEPLVAKEQSSHHRHLHPTKDLLAQLQDEDMQDECDEEEKLGDQEKRSDYVARNGLQQLSVLWSCKVAHPSNCCPFPIFFRTFLGKIRSHKGHYDCCLCLSIVMLNSWAE